VLLVLHASSSVDGLPSTARQSFFQSILQGLTLDSSAYIVSQDCDDQVMENKQRCNTKVEAEWNEEGRNDGSEKSDCCKYWAIELCLLTANRDKCTPIENMAINDAIRKHFEKIESTYCSEYPSNDKRKCKYD